MKNPWDESDREPTADTNPDKHNLTPCCCCLCACSHDRVKDATCFGCFPIKCGILFIAILIFVMSICMLTVSFFGLLNEYLPWWYTLVLILCQAPLITASFISVYFFRKDKRSTRSRLLCAIICSVISIFLWAAW